jgi:hypothetical protein
MNSGSLSYPVVELPDSSGIPVLYYRVDLEVAVLLVQKSMVDSGESSVDAEIESFLRPRQ